MLTNFSYIRAKSVSEAVKHLSSEGAVLYAGGTDLLGCLRDHVFPAEKIVSVGGLEDLRGIRQTPEGGLRIGAMTTLTEIENDPVIKKRYTGLAEAAASVASPQLRNQGTIGGNLCQKPRCWYYRGEFHCLRKGGDRCYAVAGENEYHCVLGGDQCYIVHPSDTASALVAFEASVRIAGRGGTKTVPVEALHVPPSRDVRKETILGPDEIVTEIVLPPSADVRSSYRKVQSRGSWDFAIAGIALAIVFGGDNVKRARVVLSGAAPVPWRSKEVEEAIAGRRLDAETITKAVDAAMVNARPLAHNGYKVAIFRGIVEEELKKIARA